MTDSIKIFKRTFSKLLEIILIILLLLEKPSDCIKEILEAKNNYILKMTTKRQDLKTAARSYWAILSRLLYDKTNSSITTFISYL